MLGWRVTTSPTPFWSGASMRISMPSSKANADGIEIDVVAAMQRVGADQLGLAVELAQRHAERAEEAEGIGPQRRAAGRRRAQPREAEAVAQRAEQQQVAATDRRARARAPPARLHAELVEAAA